MQRNGQDVWMIRLLEDLREAALRENLTASARAIDNAIEALKVESKKAQEDPEVVTNVVTPRQKSWH